MMPPVQFRRPNAGRRRGVGDDWYDYYNAEYPDPWVYDPSAYDPNATDPNATDPNAGTTTYDPFSDPLAYMIDNGDGSYTASDGTIYDGSGSVIGYENTDGTWTDTAGNLYDAQNNPITSYDGVTTDPTVSGTGLSDVGFDQYGNASWSLGNDSQGNSVWESVDSNGNVYHTYFDTNGNVVGYSDANFQALNAGTLGSSITVDSTGNPRSQYTGSSSSGGGSAGGGGMSGGGSSSGSGSSSSNLAKSVQDAINAALAKAQATSNPAALSALQRGLTTTSTVAGGSSTNMFLIAGAAALVLVTMLASRRN